MNITNIHRRIIDQPKEKVVAFLPSLATPQDQIWPREKWPPMRLKQGLTEGSSGGHGPIRYTISKVKPGEYIRFEFTRPAGFHGSHYFEITALSAHRTELKHTIAIQARGMGILTWHLAIRWLHNALIEDAFDKWENHFRSEPKSTKWSLWVRLLRWILTPNRHRHMRRKVA